MVEKCPFKCRIKHISNNVNPISTWDPCRPVNIKKQDPRALSEIEKVAQAYSVACKTANPSPRIRHQSIPWVTSESFPVVIAWWDQVKNAPEDNKSSVPNNGAPEGGGIDILCGGHTRPISGIGTNELVKNAQKNEANKAISLKINIIKPVIIFLCTDLVWKPKVLSSQISTAHRQRQATKNRREIKNKYGLLR